MRRSTFATMVTTLALTLGLGACQQKATDGKASKAAKSSKSMSAGQPGTDGHMGKPFTVKEVTDVAKVLADPKAYKGKKIHVKGVVVQHCHHRGAWFAVGAGNNSKQFLRVWTKHEFTVPKGIKRGVSTAEAEGVVEIQTMPEKHAKHYATEHGFFGGDPAKINGPQLLPNLKVTGAQFKL